MTAAPEGSTAVSPGRWGSTRLVLAALAVYAATRIVSGVLIARAARVQVPISWTGSPVDYWGMTLMWDGTWYRKIAEGGYPVPLPIDATGQVPQTEWAFYPLYPLLCRGAMAVTGLPFRFVGGAIATIIGFAAAAALVLLLRRHVSDGVALLALAVWGTWMASPVLQIAYTESLGMLLLVVFLLLMERERWWWAAAVALLIGVSRPIGLPLGLVALVSVIVRWRARHTRPIRRREGLGMLASLVGCAVAGWVWPAIAWWRTGVPDAYTQTMAAWRAGHAIHLFRPWWDNAHYFLGDKAVLGLVGYTVVVLALPLGPWARPLGVVIRTWMLAYPLYLFAVQDPHTSLFRYLILLFPAAVIGIGASRRVGGLTIVRAGVLVGIGIALQVWWSTAVLVLHLPGSWPP